MDDVDTITDRFLSQIADAKDSGALEDLRVAALGRKGAVTGLMKTLGQAAPEDRKNVGPTVLTKQKTRSPRRLKPGGRNWTNWKWRRALVANPLM